MWWADVFLALQCGGQMCFMHYNVVGRCVSCTTMWWADVFLALQCSGPMCVFAPQRSAWADVFLALHCRAWAGAAVNEGARRSSKITHPPSFIPTQSLRWAHPSGAECPKY
jgi:hypothetical protein